LTKDGQLYSTTLTTEKENYYQDGHLGYENYAAYGLKIWGLKVDKSLDSKSKTGFVNLYGKRVPFDNRADKGAINYVLSLISSLCFSVVKNTIELQINTYIIFKELNNDT
jgi:hypothetical protein